MNEWLKWSLLVVYLLIDVDISLGIVNFLPWDDKAVLLFMVDWFAETYKYE